MTHVNCPCCQRRVAASRPTIFDRALVPLAWLFVAVMSLFAGLLGPFLVVLSPVFLTVGASVIHTAHGRAFRDTLCPACGKVIDPSAFSAPPAPAREPAASLQVV